MVEIPGVEAAAVTVGLVAQLLTLTLPYRACSAGLIWTLGFCPTLAGDKHRSGKTQPGNLKNMGDKVKEDRHQLCQNNHHLLLVLLSILEPKSQSLWVQGLVLPLSPQLGHLERAGRAAATVAVVGLLCPGELHNLQAPT